MKEINKLYINNQKQKYNINKISKFFSFTSILKISLALALFLIAAFMISGAGVTVDNGALNVSNNLLVNTNNLFVDSANNKVGIGTANPASNIATGNRILDIGGATTPVLTLHTTDSALEGSMAVAGEGIYIDVGGHATAANNFISFRTSNTASSYTVTERMRIASNGNVGIGTTSPVARLDTRWSGQFLGSLFNRTDGGSAYIRVASIASTDDAGIEFGDNGAARKWLFGKSNRATRDFWILEDADDNKERFTIAAGGRVGIGTTNPASTLTVIGNFSATGAKAAVINTTQGAIAFYAMESTEVRLYDEGKSALTNGAATVTLDPLFAEVIDTSNYIVHVTPKGSSNGLYVEQQTPASFVVKENNAGTSNIEFSYLISGKRKEFKDVRLYKMANFDFGNQT